MKTTKEPTRLQKRFSAEIDEEVAGNEMAGALQSISTILQAKTLSGTYESTPRLSVPIPGVERSAHNGNGNGHAELAPDASPAQGALETAEANALFPFRREELRLDVDGRYPQMMASGTRYNFKTSELHWIARLKKVAENKYAGPIWYKDGNRAALPYTKVEISVTNVALLQPIAVVTYSGSGAVNLIRVYRYKSGQFHTVNFEFDFAEGVAPVTSVNTHDHANRPPNLPSESLSIQTVFRRAGFYVNTSSQGGSVPLAGAGVNARWSDAEMHDAMQNYWSRFADAPQWAMWTFFASLHEQGTSLGGIMFDDIGPNHRQGTAIFHDAFIANAPVGEAQPAAWVRRMRFWTAVHEMGHAFNLAHSWQKSLGTPWIPLSDEPEARSFMNYPYNVAGGQTGFFADFRFGFSDPELLFMRHAPFRFVQMGNADWFDDHGFQEANVSPEPSFRLELRVNRPKPVFEFLEPVVIEMKLTNISTQPQLVEEELLGTLDHCTVIIKKDGKPAREFAPFSRRCFQEQIRALEPTESIYESLFASVGRNGWDISEPGYYTIQIALHLEDEDIVSNSFELRVEPPAGYDEEYLAQDFFREDVGRVLTFDGTRFLTKAHDTLQEAVERFPKRKVALHARIALGAAGATDFKELDLSKVTSARPASVAEEGGKIKQTRPEAGATKELTAALIEKPEAAAQALGHIDYRYYIDRFSEYLAEKESPAEAAKAQDVLLKTLTSRKVLDRVLQQVKAKRDSYAKSK